MNSISMNSSGGLHRLALEFDRKQHETKTVYIEDRNNMKSTANIKPRIDQSAYIAEGAVIVGDVEIGANSSVWFNAVLRSDNNVIRIGANSNIQDGAVVHEDMDNPVIIGDNVTVGHKAIIHGCTIGNNTLIGMGAILLSGCRIGSNCMVAAGALVTGKTVVPDNSIIMGSPAKTIKPLKEEYLEEIEWAAREYLERGAEYRGGEFKQAEATESLLSELDTI